MGERPTRNKKIESPGVPQDIQTSSSPNISGSSSLEEEDATWEAMLHFEEFFRRRHPELDEEALSERLTPLFSIPEVIDLARKFDAIDRKYSAKDPNHVPWYKVEPKPKGTS